MSLKQVANFCYSLLYINDNNMKKKKIETVEVVMQYEGVIKGTKLCGF